MKDLGRLIIHCDDRYLVIFSPAKMWQNALRKMKEEKCKWTKQQIEKNPINKKLTSKQISN